MTEHNPGVIETDAESQQPGTETQSSPDINWQQAQQALAEQKKAMEDLQRQNQTYQQQLSVFQF
jgi:hypothetical protein